MTSEQAFALGALTKLAEYGIEPSVFIQAAHQFQDADAIKIAKAVSTALAGIPKKLADIPKKKKSKALRNAAIGTAGLTTIGGGIYAAGDADTAENKAKRLSNKYLGTNMKTQSRLGKLLDSK